MIFTERKITIRNGKSSINEPVILYRGDYEVSIKFTITESKFRFKSGVNLVDTEKASHGQLAILTPYGGNVFSEIVKCEDGTVTFTLTKEMIDQLEEIGLYSFQIRLFDYYRESRVSIPPVEFGIEVREPVASEDHDNEVNNAIVGYSIAKVVDGLNEDVPDTFDDNGNYNKTDWETGDRISEGKLNKIEDALDKINQNEKNDVAALDKRVTNNYNILESTKANQTDLNVERNRIDSLAKLSEGSTTGDAELIDGRVGADGITYNSIGSAIRSQVTNGYNIASHLPIIDDVTSEIKDGQYQTWSSNFGNYSTLATVYTGVVRNVVPGNKYRVTVFNPSSNGETNSCNFYDEKGVNIPQGDSFYNYRLIDETNRVVEFTAPEKAAIMTYTNYIADKSKGYCRCEVKRLNIDWLMIEHDNFSDKLKERISNPSYLTSKSIITELEPTKRETGYYLDASKGEHINDHYNTAYYNVTGLSVVRVKVYWTILGEGDNIYFWDATGRNIDIKTYEYTVYDADTKVLEIVVPDNAAELTVTELANDPIWYVQSIGGKVAPDWLEITPEMLPENLAGVNNAFNLTTEGYFSDNIINKYEWGYYIGSSGGTVSNTNMGTAYFNATPGCTYRMSVYSTVSINGPYAVIYFYDSNGKIIPWDTYEFTVISSNNKNEGEIDIIVPEGAVSGTITYKYKESGEGWYVYQMGGRYQPDWLVVGKDNLNAELHDKIFGGGAFVPYKYNHCLAKPFDFNGKSSVFFGDSITYGVMSPNLQWTSNSYGKLLANSLGMTYTSQAVSGSCFSPVNSPSAAGQDIYEKILAYNGTADFIFIAGGTNDYSVGNPVGVLGDTTPDTVYGALHVMCEHMKNNLPNATVIFITPINQNTPRPNSIAHMNVYRNAIFEVATSYGFNVVDGTQIGFPEEPGPFADAMCQDGVHPNQLGHELYANSLRGILL